MWGSSTWLPAGTIWKPILQQGLHYIPLASFPPYVCLSAEHELVRRFGRKGIHIQELQDYGFVRYIGQYEDFIYHISTEKGPIDLNDTRKVIYVNDRQEQMALLSRTNFFTVGIMEFLGQDSLYKVVSVPLLAVASISGSAHPPGRSHAVPDGK